MVNDRSSDAGLKKMNVECKFYEMCVTTGATYSCRDG